MKYPITPESPPIETETQIAPVSDLMGSKAKDIKKPITPNPNVPYIAPRQP